MVLFCSSRSLSLAHGSDTNLAIELLKLVSDNQTVHLKIPVR